MEQSIEQWYILDPERYEEEKAGMEERFETFDHYINDDNGNACWKGAVSSTDTQGELKPSDCEYNPLFITIECPADYPQSIPIVFDDQNILRKHGCIHLHAGSNKICYGMRGLDSKCNFHLDARLHDLVHQIGVFIFNQWKAEQNDNKWEVDRLHGTYGFLEQELLYGQIPLNELCPCGKNKIYKDCDLVAADQVVKILLAKGGLGVPRKIERNEKCPCESGKKYKKCCDPRRYFIQMLVEPLGGKEKVYKILKLLSEKS